jgi:hypothetical protein
MKKFFIIASVACVTLSSCTFPQNDNLNTQTVKKQNANVSNLYIKTVNTQNIEISPLLADLVISEEKITHEYIHNTNGDLKNAKDCAVYDALRKYGNADVLVAPQFDIKLNNGVERIIVSGYPAKYKNFRNDKTQKK